MITKILINIIYYFIMYLFIQQDTINRLLKKQASKSKKVIKGDDADDESPTKKLQRLQDPYCLHYVQTQSKTTLSIPDRYTVAQVFGLKSHALNEDKITTCEVKGCQAARKYVAKKSGKVVCSLEHYKLVEVQLYNPFFLVFVEDIIFLYIYIYIIIPFQS